MRFAYGDVLTSAWTVTRWRQEAAACEQAVELARDDKDDDHAEALTAQATFCRRRAREVAAGMQVGGWAWR